MSPLWLLADLAGLPRLHVARVRLWRGVGSDDHDRRPLDLVGVGDRVDQLAVVGLDEDPRMVGGDRHLLALPDDAPGRAVPDRPVPLVDAVADPHLALRMAGPANRDRFPGGRLHRGLRGELRRALTLDVGLLVVLPLSAEPA